MNLHYFTLYHIAREIDECAGMVVTECFTQEKNTLHCVFESLGGGKKRVLEARLDSRNGAIFLREEFHRARKNTLDVFPELIGRTLRKAATLPNERVIVLELPPYNLYAIVFAGWLKKNADDDAPSVANAALTLPSDGEERIINAFRAPGALKGKEFCLTSAPALALADYPADTPLARALATSRYKLGSAFANEVLARLQAFAPLTGDEPMNAEIVQSALERIEQTAEEVRQEILSATTFVLWRCGNGCDDKLLLSPLRQMHNALARGEYIQSFSSASEAVRASIAAEGKERRIKEKILRARARLKATLVKTERAIEAISRDERGAARARERRLWAELLLALPNLNERGGEVIEVQSYDGDTLRIPLNPALSLRENAENYFKKAAAARETLAVREARKRRLTTIAQRLREALTKLETLQNEKEIEAFMNNLEREHLRANHNGEAQVAHQKTTRFREFPLGENYVLYVGKTAADNDELTLKFAKPNDYWFHARGVAGSHAVLRSPHKDKKPPKRVIEKAASIAAYYSKAKNARLAPVAYAQKKYIHKPKGAAVGAVVMEREEVVMARPGLPEETQGL